MKIIKKIKNILSLPISLFCYKNRITKLPYLPYALWIEPTNVCNLKCIMCPNSIVSQPNPGFMDMKIYRQIIDEAKEYVSYIVLCISGESLLHKSFPEMVKYAKDNGISTYLSTNGTTLNTKLSKQILKAGLDWINFSFDGCTKEIYEKIRVNANFEKVLKNIKNFLKIKKQTKSKTQVDIQILIMDSKGKKDYNQNIKKFLTNFKKLPLNCVQVRPPSTWGNYFSKTKKFQPKQLSKMYSPCSYLWCSLGVLWDGKVVTCCSDFFGTNVLGTFPKNTLKEIWNDKPAIAFRKAMISNNYLKYNKNCANCDSLWEKRILGLPSGIRGVASITINSIFGKNSLILLKKIARIANPNFAMNVIYTSKK